MNVLAILTVAAAVIGLIAAVGLAVWINKADEGNDRMKEIALKRKEPPRGARRVRRKEGCRIEKTERS